MESVSMNRTFHPKYTTYRGTGTGRDTYIIVNNGTLCRPSITSPRTGYQSKVKSPIFFSKAHTAMASPHKDANTFHYMPDGTGRDGYVILGDGGLHANYKSVNFSKAFINSLRSYDCSPYAETMKGFGGTRQTCISACG